MPALQEPPPARADTLTPTPPAAPATAPPFVAPSLRPSVARPRPASLPLLLAATFACSLGTGAATNGVFFIAEQRFAFGPTANLLLGVVMGVGYVAAALAVGPLTRRISRRHARSLRAQLLAACALAGLSCLLPVIRPTAASVWIFTLVFSAATGAMWPLVESYVAAGRTGRTLRKASARFNIAWAGGVYVAFAAMSGFVEHHALAVLAAVALLHLISIPALATLPKDPPADPDHPAHSRDPAAGRDRSVDLDCARRLLAAFRLLLVLSYVLISAAGPVYPAVLGAIGLSPAVKTFCASVWLGARVATFAVMERWHGWHGRRSTPAAAALLFAAGLVWSLRPVGAVDFVLAMTASGVGQGAIYAGAFYYAMEAEAGRVDAGGKHEALIGAGYLLGPLLGVAWFALFPVAT